MFDAMAVLVGLSRRGIFFAAALAACLVFGASGVRAFEQCVLPEPPAVPENAATSEAELLKAQKVVKDFVARADGYLACTEREQAKAQALALRSSMPFSPSEQAIWNQRYNDGIDAQTNIAEAFNAQVKAWRARQAESAAAAAPKK